MTRSLDDDLLPHHGEPIDPVAMARKDLKTSLPKRFWKEVTLGPHEAGAYAILLDGRVARTPARQILAFQDQALAELLRQEWADVGAVIDPAQMPLTRLDNSGLDGVSQQMEAVQLDAARYAASDLLCYRAEHPEKLVLRQRASWDPLLDWLDKRYGARLVTGAGVMYVTQSPEAVLHLQQAVMAIAKPLPLTALHALTTLTGSLVLALDEEALARRAQRFREAQAAASLLSLTY